MPHTITKKHRPKRPDLRPSDKTRKKDNRRKADALDVTELRVVKRRKEDGPKREREVIAAAAPLKKTPAEKRVKALKKLLTGEHSELALRMPTLTPSVLCT